MHRMKNVASLFVLAMVALAVWLANTSAAARHPSVRGMPGGQPEKPCAQATALNPSTEPPDGVVDYAQEQRPGFPLKYIGSEQGPGDEYVWSRWSYTTREATNRGAYGVIHVLWHLASSMPVWSVDWGGDFQPHSLAWLDFDGDGSKDLLLFAGFEDYFDTRVYLWRLDTSSSLEEALVEVYANGDPYSVILDFEGDGRPEILDSGNQGREYVEDECWEYRLGDPQTVRDALGVEYRSLARGYDQFNFTYNMPDHYPSVSMKILDPIRILSIEGSSVVDVTTRYPDHLRWRLGLLREIRAANSGECLALVDSVISYLERRLVEVQSDTAPHSTSEGTCQRRH